MSGNAFVIALGIVFYNGIIVLTMTLISELLFGLGSYLGKVGRGLAWFLTMTLLVPPALLLCWLCHFPVVVVDAFLWLGWDVKTGRIVGFSIFWMFIFLPVMKFFIDNIQDDDGLTGSFLSLSKSARAVAALTVTIAFVGHVVSFFAFY